MINNAAICGSTQDERKKLGVLTLQCPICGGNPDDCPLHRIRKLPHAVRDSWCYGLDIGEIKWLIDYHNSCLQNKIDRVGFTIAKNWETDECL